MSAAGSRGIWDRTVNTADSPGNRVTSASSTVAFGSSRSGNRMTSRRMVRAVTALDDGLCDEFLADAAFATEDDGGAGASNGFDGLIDLLHSGTAAD